MLLKQADAATCPVLTRDHLAIKFTLQTCKLCSSYNICKRENKSTTTTVLHNVSALKQAVSRLYSPDLFLVSEVKERNLQVLLNSKIVPVHTMKACRSRSIAPLLISTLDGDVWVNLPLRRVSSCNLPRYPSNGRLRGPRNQPGPFGVEKIIFPLPRSELRNVQAVARGLYAHLILSTWHPPHPNVEMAMRTGKVPCLPSEHLELLVF